MRAKALTERQAQTLEAIREHVRRTGTAPSRSELAEAIGVRHQHSVDAHLLALEKKGWIALEHGRARGIRVLREDLTIYGEVPMVSAGTPMLAEDGAIQPEMTQVKALLGGFSERPDFFVKVRGDSMDRTGIKDGDIVAVRRDPEPNEGDLVIARIDNEITMKRYHHAGDHVELQPESSNAEHRPIQVELDCGHEIVGVVVGAIIGAPAPRRRQDE